MSWYSKGRKVSQSMQHSGMFIVTCKDGVSFYIINTSLECAQKMFPKTKH